MAKTSKHTMHATVSSRLVRALGLSLLAHVAVLAANGRPGATPAVLAAFEPIEVVLAGAPARPRPAAPATAPAPQSGSPELPATGTSESFAPADDSPLVEARADVAALDNPKPPYPLAARRAGLEGRVLLSVHVRADGSCAEVRLRQSSGHALLDDAALTTVRRWRFLPARRGDTPVESWVDVPVSFRLHG